MKVFLETREAVLVVAIIMAGFAAIFLGGCGSETTPPPSAATAFPSTLPASTTTPALLSTPSVPLGINLGFAGGRSREFVDAAKTRRGWEKIGPGRCQQTPRTCDTAPQDVSQQARPEYLVGERVSAR